ncbi:hypothetical protein H6777_03945 [Candidatus Nomurabacteria bacterium]|nr:hypothetical protein [Candidatus Nomurabacteria bacterium]
MNQKIHRADVKHRDSVAIFTSMICERTVKDFQEAIEQELGRKLEEKEATEILTQLVGYFDTLAKIDHREKTQVS